MFSGIYIHIPFCVEKCDYCSFYSEKTNCKDIDDYCNALIEEIIERFEFYRRYKFDSIYIGGGTPSLLEVRQVEKVLTTLKKYYFIKSDSEVTIEINPGNVYSGYLKSLMKAGINRFSFGIQSISNECRNFIGRNSGNLSDDFYKEIETIREENFSFDYIVGIPGQSRKTIQNEINHLIKYNPKHFSIYMLTLEPNTPLFNRYSPGEDFDKFQIDIYNEVKSILTRNGFNRYEISAFAKDDYFSVHNLKYWSLKPYAGFGAKAHSFNITERRNNNCTYKEYLNRNYSVEIEKLTGKDILKDYIYTGLRTDRGVTESDYSNLIHNAFDEGVVNLLEKLTNQGKLNKKEINGEIFYSISEKYYFLADSVIQEIIFEI